MRTNTPPLGYKQKEEYIREHLFNELRWLLGAATEWSIQNQLNLGIVGYNVQVYAMDSVFLHARVLFEFFTKPTSTNYYGCSEFLGGNRVLKSSSYTNGWAHPLHKSLMHAQDRSQPTPLNTSDGQKDLNQMPVYFAREILRLWEEFEVELGKTKNQQDQVLQKLAYEKRNEAIEKAGCVVNSAVAQCHAEVKEQKLEPVFVVAG